jgi:hypothetical protein
VNPNRVAVGQGSFEPAGILAKTLLETCLPIPAAVHAPKIIRSTQKEKERENNVVPKSHPVWR